MKIECIKDKFKDAIVLAEKATGKNLTLPILNTILLEAKNKTLYIKATNLEIGLEIEIPAKVEEEGSTAINAQIISSFLNNLPKENKIELSLNENNLSLSTETTKTIIKSITPEDFPTIPKVINSKEFNLNSKDFISGLKSVLFASAVSDIKPEIASIYIYNEESFLIFVATDSFRLAEKKIKLKNPLNDFNPIIIPFKNISEIIRVFENNNNEIKINSDEHQLSIYSDSIHLTSRLINGNYPAYQQIMPNEFKTEVVINKDELINTLKLANIFSDKFNQVDFNLLTESNILEINSQNQDIGENKISLIIKIKGEDIKVSFNVKYIIDCFSSINSKNVSLKFTDKNKPLLIQSLDDEFFKYIIMPVNR